jgi:hypothetical protein
MLTMKPQTIIKLLLVTIMIREKLLREKLNFRFYRIQEI